MTESATPSGIPDLTEEIPNTKPAISTVIKAGDNRNGRISKELNILVYERLVGFYLGVPGDKAVRINARIGTDAGCVDEDCNRQHNQQE